MRPQTVRLICFFGVLLIYAIDFDGTLCVGPYPEIGEPRRRASGPEPGGAYEVVRQAPGQYGPILFIRVKGVLSLPRGRPRGNCG